MVEELTSELSTYRPFVFSVVKDDGENVTIEVSEEDYQADLAAGINEDDTLKPGRYKMKRGGFLKRHTELKLTERGEPDRRSQSLKSTAKRCRALQFIRE